MYNFNIFVEKENKFYIAHNLELGVVSQGETYEKALKNLKEASELYLEDEDKEKLVKMFTNKNYSLTNMVI
ncbi:MAG: type II toxin-antitoxin system HicB family antitoxin [Candidatus Gracilibacteria bacterium]|nr:type II toxin-antitoxin system HicB family antitoxin [Candidatus Gracilibacteria bacterium]